MQVQAAAVEAAVRLEVQRRQQRQLQVEPVEPVALVVVVAAVVVLAQLAAQAAQAAQAFFIYIIRRTNEKFCSYIRNKRGQCDYSDRKEKCRTCDKF